MGIVRGENSLFFASGLDNSGLKQGSFGAVGIVQGLANKVSKINPFAAIAVSAVAAFTIIANEGYKMAKSFESAMAEVKTIANVSEGDFKKLEKDVFGIYKSLGTEPPDKLANGLYEIIGAGFEASDALTLLEISSKAATAGVTATAVASDGLTTILNAFQLSASDAQEVADIMFATVDRGKISFEELSSQIAVVAPLAASSGYSFQEIAAAIATLTKQGVPAGVAMTQIRSGIIAVNEVMGDGVSETLSLQEAFQLMFDKAGGSQKKLKDLAGRIEAVNGILSIAGPNMKGAAKDLEAMGRAAGSVDRSFNIITSTTDNQWKILRNTIKATTKGIGNAVLDMSSGFAKGINDMLKDTYKLSKAIEEERTELFILESKIKNVNTSNEDRIKIINELKKRYPGLLSNIDAEAVSNEELSKSIKKINEQLINKIILQRKDDEITKQREKAAEKREKFLLKEAEVQERISELVKKHSLEIKDNASVLEQAKDIFRQLDEKGVSDSYIFGDKSPFGTQIRNLEALKLFADNTATSLDKLSEERDALALKLGIKIDEEEKEEIPAEIQKVLDEIKAITFDQFKDDPGVFDQYLKSQNELIQKAAKERKRLFSIDPDKDEDNRTETEKFSDQLKAKEEQYKAYFLAIENGDAKLAQKLKENYNLKEADYKNYLRNLYRITDSTDQKTEILKALDELDSKLIINAEMSPIVDITPNAEKELEKFSENAAKQINEDIERKKSSAKNIARARAKIERDEQEKFLKFLENSSLKELLIKRKTLEQSLQETKQNLGEVSDEYKKLKEQIGHIDKEIGSEIARIADDFASAFSGLSSLFQKFGDEDAAQLLDQLSGVASGVGRIAAGDIVGGISSVLNSAITVEVDSDTEKFEAAIRKLEKVVSDLDYQISRSVGEERIGAIRDAIDARKDEIKALNDAVRAESAARKETKFFGIRVSRGGIGSGTDQSKIEAFRDEIEQARQEMDGLNDELDELLTGSTQSSLTDSIINGFKEGKRAVKDFVSDFEDLMREAMFQAFQTEYLQQASKDFFSSFSDAADDGLHPAEIAALRLQFNDIAAQSMEELEALNEILESAGIAGGVFGDINDQQGLAGSIKNITADQADVMAGTLNRISLDIRNGVEIAQQNAVYLSQISYNTSFNKYLEYLESMDTRLSNIETSLS